MGEFERQGLILNLVKPKIPLATVHLLLYYLQGRSLFVQGPYLGTIDGAVFYYNVDNTMACYDLKL